MSCPRQQTGNYRAHCMYNCSRSGKTDDARNIQLAIRIKCGMKCMIELCMYIYGATGRQAVTAAET